MSLIQADARHLPLRDACVDCCVTSPPYFGLRDYGSSDQIGLEHSPTEYVGSLVAVFSEIRRVLKPEGTAWLNLGDSYSGGGRGTGGKGPNSKQRTNIGSYFDSNTDFETQLPDKNLMGIPWRVAFALQADGWYLRADIIWHKPNPMPESVTDRPTKSHEYLFLLTKSQRYYYDAQAIAEPVSGAMLDQMEQGYDGLGLKDYESAGVQNPSTVKALIIQGTKNRQTPKQANQHRLVDNVAKARQVGAPHDNPFGLTRNKRTVWAIASQPFRGAHFATMPEALVQPCILAGCPEGGLVLDPFIGSGTVGVVAEELGRRWVGTDLRYHDIAARRTAQRGLRFDDDVT